MNLFKFNSSPSTQGAWLGLGYRWTGRGGLECGASGAKLVLLSKSGSAFQVDHIFIEEYLFAARIKGKTLSPLDIVRRLLLHKNLAGYQIVFTANEAVKSCFMILPKMNKMERDGALLLQARKLLSWEGDHPLMTYISSEFLGNQEGTMVALADWPAVKPWCLLAEGSGATVNDLIPEVCAYLALARRQEWARESPVSLVADMGVESSKFYILDNQTVRFMREVPIGGDAITKMLTTEVSTEGGPLRLTDIEAEEIKIAGRFTPEIKKDITLRPIIESDVNAERLALGNWETKLLEHMNTLVRPAIERLSSEITRSIQFYRDNVGQKVDAVYITGGTSCLPALKKHLEASLSLPVKLIDPFAGLNFADAATRRYAEAHKSRLALAVGLALAEQPAISLLLPHMKIMKRLASFMPSAVAVLLLLGFLPFAVGGTCQAVKIKFAQTANKQYQMQADAIEKEYQYLLMYQQKYQELSEHRAALQQLAGRAPLWPGIFNTLSDAVPNDIMLTGFSASQEPNVAVIEGNVLPSAADFDNALSAFLSSLSASPFFKQVNLVKAQAKRTEKTLGSFEIQCELIY